MGSYLRQEEGVKHPLAVCLIVLSAHISAYANDDTPVDTSLDLTHLVDVYRFDGRTHYTNTSDRILVCQISTHNPENHSHMRLPLGTLAEKKNITLRQYQSYVHHRNGHQIILCYAD